ncbi:BtpA/SgcQ family protein [bacterium]|nr:BtpA/SgcQ family protein [bacterium]
MSDREVLGRKQPLIAMLHLPPSPGVEGHGGMVASIEIVLGEARLYKEAGLSALMIENMHDFPCIREKAMGPEVATYFTRIACELRRELGESFLLGAQVLFAASKTALAVAQAAELNFIRSEGWIYGHLSDKGWIDGQAGPVKRYQHAIGAEDVAIFTDIQKKHASHAVTADLSIADLAGMLTLHKSDGAIVTGGATGEPPTLADLEAVRGASNLPVLIGSGLNAENLPDYAPLADAFIVGSVFKEKGRWNAPLDRRRIDAFMDAYARL